LLYLLDTNIVSYFLRGRPTIVAKIREAGGIDTLFVTAITVAEQRYGAEVMPEGRKKEQLVASLDVALDSVEVLPFTQDAAAAFGWARALLEKEGVGWTWPDLAVASVGLAENMTVVSNDGFFQHVEYVCGLKFERWEP
jgi:predicted nucleic acid-binding protein